MLTKFCSKRATLDRVTLAVERKELLALIGPNGAGKTSVLNCISTFKKKVKRRSEGANAMSLVVVPFSRNLSRSLT